MVAPTVISASRRTDIPAFHADWFMDCMRKGRAEWINPFSRRPVTTDLSGVRFIVFWTKDAAPILQYLDELRIMGTDFYFQYTLNDYDGLGLETDVPPLSERVETFKRLSDMIGQERVIWRFDPIIITDTLSRDDVLDRIRKLAERVKDHTRKLVFSFCDYNYRKVEFRLRKEGIRYRELSEEEMIQFSKELRSCVKSVRADIELATCAESVNLSASGIKHNSCVDKELILRLAPDDNELKRYLDTKSAGQRPLCNCAKSVDIGSYDTCGHGCKYCYAMS